MSEFPDEVYGVLQALADDVPVPQQLIDGWWLGVCLKRGLIEYYYDTDARVGEEGMVPALTLEGVDALKMRDWPARTATSDERPRLTVDLDKMKLRLDDVEYEVDSKQALRWVQVLAEHPGDWISSAELKEYDPELDGCRPDRHCKPYLPAEILDLIKSDTKKGSRLRLP